MFRFFVPTTLLCSFVVLAGCGGGGGGGGGGAPVVLTSSRADGSQLSANTSASYNASLDTTWTARQEYKNVRYYDYPNQSFPDNPESRGYIHPYTLVGVNNAFARGLSGNGKTIAILDTGFLNTIHAEVIDKNTAGKYNTYGTLSYDSYSGSNCADANGCFHGMHVAGIAAADYNNNASSYVVGATTTDWSGSVAPLLGYGTVGVAPSAGLHLSDYTKKIGGVGTRHWEAATNAARTAGAIVQNNSWGKSDSSSIISALNTRKENYSDSNGAAYSAVMGDGTAANWDAYALSLNTFQASGVVVRASGNDTSQSEVGGMAEMPLYYTELQEAWLNVGNLVVSGSDATSSTVTRLSNQCGLTAAFCIFADGYQLTSSIGGFNNGMYYSYNGSSLTAPIVSGAIALLSEAFPTHTPEQLVDRIIATADNTFFTKNRTLTFGNGITHAYNAEYGHGILDLEKALSPITSSMFSNSILVGNNYSSSIHNARRFDLNSSNINLGSAFGDSISQALEGKTAYFYDALYGGFAFDLGALVKTTKSKENMFKQYKNSNNIRITEPVEGIRFITKYNKVNPSENNLMLINNTSDKNSTFIGNNIDIQSSFHSVNHKTSENKFDTTDIPNIPYLQASQNGLSTGIKTSFDSSAFLLGGFSGDSQQNRLATKGFVAEYALDFSNSDFSFFAGQTSEKDGFLDTAIRGAFADNPSAETTYFGALANGQISKNWDYNVALSFGDTDFTQGSIGLLKDINNVKSSAFSFDFKNKPGIFDNDGFRVGFSQPFRVESGEATISVPGLYDEGGKLKYENMKVPLSPSGRQLDVNFRYVVDLKPEVQIGSDIEIMMNHGHISSNQKEFRSRVFAKILF